MSIYIQHSEVQLQNQAEGIIEFKIGFVPYKVLVGFDKFDFSYNNKNDKNEDTNKTDHHVRELGLNIDPVLNGESLKCTVKGVFNDNSGNKMKTGSVRVSVVAYDAGESLSDAMPVSALQGFNFKYDKKDHHVGRYAICKNEGFMEDNSENQAVLNTCKRSPVTMVPRAVYDAMRSEDIHFINSFGMGMKNGDHHVSHTGIEICKDGVRYDLWDKEKNHAEFNFCEFDVSEGGEFPDEIIKLSIKGNEISVAGGMVNADIDCHIQGIVKYNNLYVMSHNKSDSKGFFLVSGKDKYLKFNSYDMGYSHPGGMQRYENYMLVGAENSSHKESIIRLYDLSGMSLDKKPQICEDFKIERETGTCSVGICRLNNTYVIAAYAPHGNYATVDFYTAPADEKLCKTEFGKISATANIENDSDYQNIALYADQNGTMYFVGFRSHSNHIDYIDLYKVEIQDKTAIFQTVFIRHVCTSHHNPVREFGVHFRYGAALETDSNGNIMVLATQRNFEIGKVLLNEFR